MGTLAAGIKEIFATAKTTGSNVMLCGNDGTPDGHMTMANLASVLGGGKTRINMSEGIDNIKTPGIYYLNGTSGQDGSTDDAIMIVTSAQDPYDANSIIISQERTPKGNFSKKYIRHYHRNIGWSNWFVIEADMPSFYKNYADLSSLASALGVQNVGRITPGADFNNFKGGIIVGDFGSIDGISNAPTGQYYGAFISVTGANQTLQIAIDSNNKFAIRHADSDDWTSWKNIG